MNAQGALLKSCLGPLARYSTHQETMSGRLKQVYLPSDSRLDLPLRQAWAFGQIWHWSKSLSNVAEYCYQIC